MFFVNCKSFEVFESSFLIGGDEGKIGFLVYWVWIWGVGMLFINCLMFLLGCCECVVFCYIWNR